MAQPAKQRDDKVISKKYAKIPALILEENNLFTGEITFYYGKNCKCLIILPKGTKLNNDMQARINILTSETLD